jgi:hypothetical protein
MTTPVTILAAQHHYMQDVQCIIPPYVCGQLRPSKRLWIVLDDVLHMVSTEDIDVALHFVPTELGRVRAEGGFVSRAAVEQLLDKMLTQLRRQQ